MTAEIETMIQTLSGKWNVAIRSPWNTETEKLQDWELSLIPRESHWGSYPKFSGKTLREVVTAAMTGNDRTLRQQPGSEAASAEQPTKNL